MKVERRIFLKGVGSAAATVAVNKLAFAQEQNMSVGVVGGGIVGASVALHLSSAGARVTLFEKAAPAAGATGNSFAWLNAYTSNPHYRALRMKSISAYQELDRQLKLNISWGGGIHWATGLADAERMRAVALEFSQAGYDTRIIDAGELATIVPNVRLGPIETAMFSALDGHLDPVYVTKKMLDAAKQNGADIVHPCEVRELKFQGSRLSSVSTTAGEYLIDRLVIAGGTDTPALAAQAGYTLPLLHAPGILLHTKAAKPVLARVVESTDIYFKQFPDGRIVGSDSPYAPDIPEHHAVLQRPQEMPEEIRAMHGERILGGIKNKLPAAIDAFYDHLTLGYRPMPQDRLPVVGQIQGNPDVYIAVMHSGVTLAPIMGRYISQEILNDDLIDELAPYRPNRF
jgi:glycine/D-amino acid oxidase-like deaminating enzyme